MHIPCAHQLHLRDINSTQVLRCLAIYAHWCFVYKVKQLRKASNVCCWLC